MFEAPKNFQPFTTEKKDAFKRFRPLTNKEKAELGLGEKRKSKEIASPILRASWKNPETQVEREIKIDIQERIDLFEKIYHDNLQMKIDRNEIISIWNRNFKSIKREIEIYGYDAVLIVPENLPTEQEVNEKIIETMNEGADKVKVAATKYWIDKSSIVTPKKPKYKIILTKEDRNMSETVDPFLKTTLGKSIEYLTGLNKQEITERIQKGGELPINFKTNIGGREIEVKADGMSLSEYMIFQRAHFEKNKNHLDENGWTWLPKSCSGSRVVRSSWAPDGRQLYVSANDPDDAYGDLGLRLSRSFS